MRRKLEPCFINKSSKLTPVIPATQKAEIRKIAVQSQPRQIVPETLSQGKKNHKEKRAGAVAQDIGPEFKT
jgi:hypothetical protein